MVIGATCRPTSFEQYWEWAKTFMPNKGKLYMVGLPAICWVLWKSRNSKLEDKMDLEVGAEALKETVLQFHPHEATPEDAGMVLV
ncbi:hypothetical protein SETIT_2G211500v2 [Setaria italica]|uniref:Uncharacterized protein n=1 Tax=Setaria italica TaxID=4555 RepID=A0A368Q1J4_SETIT|nr:hypothetical protein SETIT_2G211500v2 [Setaria italica]